MRPGAFLCRAILVGGCFFFIYGVVVIGQRYPGAAMLILAYLAWRRLRRRGGGSDWSHGTARWCGLLDLVRAKLLGNTGLILGRAYTDRPTFGQAIRGLISPFIGNDMACRLFFAAFGGSRDDSGRLIRVPNYVHLATFAPTGAGKGTAVVVPNLLSYPKSIIATDVKGELYKLTSRHRKKRFGHQVFRLDPFGIGGPAAESATLNPLDSIDHKADDFLDQCRDLASMLVVRTGKEPDPHWNDAAQMVLCAIIAYVCGCESDRRKRTLTTVRKIVSSRHRFARALETMQQEDACQGVISREGHKLSWFQDEELGSVLTTVQRHTEYLDSPVIARNTATSSFKPEILRGQADLFLCLPPEKLASLAGLQRMWIGTLLRALAKNHDDESKPVLWLLDEVGHIGHIQALEDACTLLRGAGMRLWFFFQDQDQVRKCFGDNAATVIGNIRTQQFFGLSSYETAEIVSKRIGDTTILTESLGDNSGRSRPDDSVGKGQQAGSTSTGSSISYSNTGRRLIKPEEMLGMSEDDAIILHLNNPPIVARLVKYYDAPEFRHGRTGRQRGLGLGAGIKAVAILLVSMVFASVIDSLPPPPPTFRTAAREQTNNAPQDSYFGARPVPVRHPVRRPLNRRLSNQNDFLMPPR